jgi:F420-dependent methylenetetrahydromethanopterin dehydrogenase
VKTDRINIDLCLLGNRAQMAPASVECSFQRLLCNSDKGV